MFGHERKRCETSKTDKKDKLQMLMHFLCFTTTPAYSSTKDPHYLTFVRCSFSSLLASEVPTYALYKAGQCNALRGDLFHITNGTNGQCYKDKMAKMYDTENIHSCGQSYKHFTLVNYDPRVVIWGIFQSGTTLKS